MPLLQLSWYKNYEFPEYNCRNCFSYQPLRRCKCAACLWHHVVQSIPRNTLELVQEVAQPLLKRKAASAKTFYNQESWSEAFTWIEILSFRISIGSPFVSCGAHLSRIGNIENLTLKYSFLEHDNHEAISLSLYIYIYIIIIMYGYIYIYTYTQHTQYTAP